MTRILSWGRLTRVEGTLIENGDYLFDEEDRLIVYRRIQSGEILTVFEYEKGLLLRRCDYQLEAFLPANTPTALSALHAPRVTTFV